MLKHHHQSGQSAADSPKTSCSRRAVDGAALLQSSGPGFDWPAIFERECNEFRHAVKTPKDAGIRGRGLTPGSRIAGTVATTIHQQSPEQSHRASLSRPLRTAAARLAGAEVGSSDRNAAVFWSRRRLGRSTLKDPRQPPHRHRARLSGASARPKAAPALAGCCASAEDPPSRGKPSRATRHGASVASEPNDDAEEFAAAESSVSAAGRRRVPVSALHGARKQ